MAHGATPVADLYDPGWQAKQGSPLAAAVKPALHRHRASMLAPGDVSVLFGHCAHAEDFRAAVAEEYLPLLHSEQLYGPLAFLYVPAGQATHLLTLLPEYPGPQRQKKEPTVLKQAAPVAHTGELAFAHSLTSAQDVPLPPKPALQAQV